MTKKRKTPSDSDGELTLPVNVTAQLNPVVKYHSTKISPISASTLKGFNKLLKNKGYDLLPPEIVEAVEPAFADGVDDRLLRIPFSTYQKIYSMRCMTTQKKNLKSKVVTMVTKKQDDGGLGFKPDSASVFARYLMDDLGIQVFKDQHDIAYLRYKGQVHSLDQKKGRLVIMSLALANNAPVSSTFITNVCAVLSAVAITESEEPEFVYLRFAPYQTGSLIDLGSHDQEVILVDAKMGGILFVVQKIYLSFDPTQRVKCSDRKNVKIQRSFENISTSKTMKIIDSCCPV